MEDSTSKVIQYRVMVDPLAQPRAKASRVGGFVRMYTPEGKKVEAYKAAIRDGFLEVRPHDFSILEGPVRVTLGFYFKRSGHYLKRIYPDEAFPHIIKPDIDNLDKAVLDAYRIKETTGALTKYVWNDDCQVFSLAAEKYFVPVVYGGRIGRKRLSADPWIDIKIEYWE